VCARYTLRKKRLKDVADALDAEISDDDGPLYRPRYNVAPTDVAWIVEPGAGRRVLRPATWNYLMSNGRPLFRGENLGSGSGYREAFASRRCAVGRWWRPPAARARHRRDRTRLWRECTSDARVRVPRVPRRWVRQLFDPRRRARAASKSWMATVGSAPAPPSGFPELDTGPSIARAGQKVFGPA
jgi:hypothetical protein